MNPNSILHPVFAMVTLTALVLIVMGTQRMRALRLAKVPFDQMNTRDALNRALSGRDNAGNNWMNLFELPVLFYALAAIALATGKVTPLLVSLAWAFVGLRALHSLVHCTYNKLAHRAPIWMVGAVVLFAAWVVFARSVV